MKMKWKVMKSQQVERQLFGTVQYTMKMIDRSSKQKTCIQVVYLSKCLYTAR